MTKAVDRIAMQRAIGMMCDESPATRAQIEDKFEREGPVEAGQFAAYHCQCNALHLKPWEPPPMWATPTADGPDDGIMGWKRAEQLALRLHNAGLSLFELDPIGALQRVERAPACGPWRGRRRAQRANSERRHRPARP